MVEIELNQENLMTLCLPHHNQKTAWAKTKRNKNGKSKYYYDYTRNKEIEEVIKDLKSNPIPNYYVGNTYGYEARKVVEDWDLSFNVGTAVTYLLRSSYKHDRSLRLHTKGYKSS